MGTVLTQFTANDGHIYVVSVDSSDTDSATVYISDESKNDVEIPLDVFVRMARVINAVI